MWAACRFGNILYLTLYCVFTFVLINGPNYSVLVEGNQKLIRNCISLVKYVSGQAIYIYVTVLYRTVQCTLYLG